MPPTLPPDPLSPEQSSQSHKAHGDCRWVGNGVAIFCVADSGIHFTLQSAVTPTLYVTYRDIRIYYWTRTETTEHHVLLLVIYTPCFSRAINDQSNYTRLNCVLLSYLANPIHIKKSGGV